MIRKTINRFRIYFIIINSFQTSLEAKPNIWTHVLEIINKYINFKPQFHLGNVIIHCLVMSFIENAAAQHRHAILIEFNKWSLMQCYFNSSFQAACSVITYQVFYLLFLPVSLCGARFQGEYRQIVKNRSVRIEENISNTCAWIYSVKILTVKFFRNVPERLCSAIRN